MNFTTINDDAIAQDYDFLSQPIHLPKSVEKMTKQDWKKQEEMLDRVSEATNQWFEEVVCPIVEEMQQTTIDLEMHDLKQKEKERRANCGTWFHIRRGTSIFISNVKYLGTKTAEKMLFVLCILGTLRPRSIKQYSEHTSARHQMYLVGIMMSAASAVFMWIQPRK